MGLIRSRRSISKAVSAEQMRAEFERYMGLKGIVYNVFDEDDNIVKLHFGGKRYDTFVLVDFDEDDDCTSTRFVSFFARCEEEDMAACRVKLNDLNKRFRWIRFWMDDDGEITADFDAIVHIDSVGPDCIKICLRMSNALEDALEALEGTASLAIHTFHRFPVFRGGKYEWIEEMV